jgi:hypothetical protein
VYIDSCHLNLEQYLDTFISWEGTNAVVTNQNWQELPRLCHGITTALISLHDQGIHLNGHINPRTVMVKRRGQGVPQITLPERWNVFNNRSQQYSISGADQQDAKRKDLLTWCLVIYFVQSCGQSFGMRVDHNYSNVLSNRKKIQNELEKMYVVQQLLPLRHTSSEFGRMS